MSDRQSAITRILLEEIASGRYPAGSALPTEKLLEERFGVSRHYVHYAVRNLQEWGIVRRRKKGGTTVCRLPSGFELQKCKNRQSSRVCLLNHLSPNYSYAHIHYNERLIDALRRKLEGAGLSLEIHEIGPEEDAGKYFRRLSDIIADGVQALLIVPGGRAICQFPELLFRLHDRVFVFNRGGGELDQCVLNQVGINNFADGVTAVEAALMGGAERLIFCYTFGTSQRHWLVERRRGVSAGGWRLNPERFFLDHFTLGGQADFPLQSPDPKTALIACHDECAAYCIEAGTKAGLEAGRDYKLIGFGDDARYRDLELTTLSPDLENIAARLADGIVAGTSPGFRGETFNVMVKSRLIRRRTL